MGRTEHLTLLDEPWEDPAYAGVVAVESEGASARVGFANGDQITVDIAALGLGGDAELGVDEDSASLIARTKDGDREIDWMVLRSLSDPAFAEEVRRRDAEEARRIGTRLRVLRENRGIKQKDAAKMVGMSAPQLSKLEQGQTDMRVSTIRTLLRALDGSFADIAGPDAPEVSVKELAQRAKAADAPVEVIKRITERVAPRRLPDVLARGFAWDRGELLAGVPTVPALNVQVAFHSRSEAPAPDSPLLRLARTVSELSASATDSVVSALPHDPVLIRREIINQSGEVTLESLTDWAWRMGIVVVPMSGPGFAAAAWYVDDKPVIVIKSAPDLAAYWLFTLAHEIGHILCGHVREQRGGSEGIVDQDSPADAIGDEAPGDDEEREANQFALDLLLPDRERLFAEIRKRSGDSFQTQKRKFKFKATDVAREAELNVPLLALSAAYALTDVAEPRDRWGSATNLAKEEGPARPTVAAAFAQRVELGRLSELDATLLEAVVLE